MGSGHQMALQQETLDLVSSSFFMINLGNMVLTPSQPSLIPSPPCPLTSQTILHGVFLCISAIVLMPLTPVPKSVLQLLS